MAEDSLNCKTIKRTVWSATGVFLVQGVSILITGQGICPYDLRTCLY